MVRYGSRTWNSITLLGRRERTRVNPAIVDKIPERTSKFASLFHTGHISLNATYAGMVFTHGFHGRCVRAAEGGSNKQMNYRDAWSFTLQGHSFEFVTSWQNKARVQSAHCDRSREATSRSAKISGQAAVAGGLLTRIAGHGLAVGIVGLPFLGKWTC